MYSGFGDAGHGDYCMAFIVRIGHQAPTKVPCSIQYSVHDDVGEEASEHRSPKNSPRRVAYFDGNGHTYGVYECGRLERIRSGATLEHSREIIVSGNIERFGP